MAKCKKNVQCLLNCFLLIIWNIFVAIGFFFKNELHKIELLYFSIKDLQNKHDWNRNILPIVSGHTKRTTQSIVVQCASGLLKNMFTQFERKR